MDFFESLGVSSYDDNGYIYPASLQASTIVWALTDRLKILVLKVIWNKNVKITIARLKKISGGN